MSILLIIFVLQFLLAPFFTDLSMKWFYKAKFDYEKYIDAAVSGK